MKSINKTLEQKAKLINNGEMHNVDEILKEDDYRVRLTFLIKSNEPEVIKRFTDDSSPIVRAEVASKGIDLDILKNDEKAYVRVSVALHQDHHNILANDMDWTVRQSVARNSKNLDVLEKLLDDNNFMVRKGLAENKLIAHKLIGDEHNLVKNMAKATLETH